MGRSGTATQLAGPPVLASGIRSTSPAPPHRLEVTRRPTARLLPRRVNPRMVGLTEKRSCEGRRLKGFSDGDVAQLGEHCLCKAGVAGSTPVVSTAGWSSFGLGVDWVTSRRRCRGD